MVRLTARERLGGGRYRDSIEEAADLLFDDEPTELKLSDVFRRAFGADMILNRSRRKGILHIAERNQLPSHKQRWTRDFRKWIEKQPTIRDQGDGIRSFSRMMLSILVSPKSIIVIDEPEVFLHPPQIRHLARLIATDTPKDTQLFIATHSDIFLRSLLDVADDRVVVVRLRREGEINPTSILKSNDITELWRDPQLRTSNVLSALFHEVAIICEGESDARFLRALMDATQDKEHEPDVHFYHCGGKDRIAGISRALRAVKVPVTAIVDIDVLSDRQKFKKLFESMGGNFAEIEKDLSIILKTINERKAQVTGRLFVSELQKICDGLEEKSVVPQKVTSNISNLISESSPWKRVKEDGYRGFSDADSISAFRAIEAASSAVGLLINFEGELEGFCREISRANKSEWLAKVLERNLATDSDLEDARKFVNRLRSMVEQVSS